MHAFVLLAIIWIGSQDSAAQASESETLAAEVVRLAPAAWADYIERRKALATLQVAFELEVRNLEGALVRKWGMASKKLGESLLSMQFVHEAKKGDLPRCTLHGVNPRYAFELVRSDLSGPYTVAEVKLLADGLPSFADLVGLGPRPPSQADRGLSAPGLHLSGDYGGRLGYDWHGLFTHPQSHLTLVSATRDREQPHAVKVAGHGHTRKGTKVRFTATFDSSSYWLPVAWEYTDHNMRSVITQTFGYTVDGLPLLTQTRVHLEQAPGSSMAFPDGPLVSTQTVTYDPRPPRELDFTLSAFGLPEPFGVTWDRPTPWWLYALISAGVLFVVAVIVSFRKRRLAARQSA